MCMCQKCKKMTALLAVLLGIAFLLVDLGIWTFWNVKWWSALLLLVGVVSFATSCCKDCEMVCKWK